MPWGCELERRLISPRLKDVLKLSSLGLGTRRKAIALIEERSVARNDMSPLRVLPSVRILSILSRVGQ